jgi:acetyl-CoA acyltransferase 1
MATQRLGSLLSQLSPTKSGVAAMYVSPRYSASHIPFSANFKRWSSTNNVIDSTQKNPDDVVITLAIRTPLAKGKKGGFKDTDLDFMVYSLLKEVVNRSNLDPKLVEDICLGNVSILSQP